MKNYFLLLLQLSLCSFSTARQTFNDQQIAVWCCLQKDSVLSSWIDDFKSFRIALYNNDITRLKNYFSSPVKNNNDIWYLLLDQQELEQRNVEARNKDFTEADFNKYYRKLFPESFIKALLKIKAVGLTKEGESESPIIIDKNTSIKLYASFDKKAKMLTLNLSYATKWEQEGENVEVGESNIIYSFRVLRNNRLQFVKVELAG